ncbi:MAG: RidA family protein [Verrucomicrobia bacterium]|nr:MAG: RidA family protein [Verrucomicrobiota bacterium]
MKKEIRHPDKKFTYGLFSAGIASDGWLFVSGQGPLDMKTGLRVPGTIEEETARTLANLERILGEAGCTRDDVVKCTCYLADMDDFEGFNRAYGEFFTGTRPARTTVGAQLMKSIRVEIDAIACHPDGIGSGGSVE